MSKFYRRPPRFSEWLGEEARLISYEPDRRRKVASILHRQNHALGASSRTFDALERFRDGAHAVVTGQQVGLFGAPLFALLKAVSAIAHAERATAQGINCVPIFWLATEDHDLAEINHVHMLGRDGLLHRLATPTLAAEHTPVGEVRFGAEIEPLVEEAAGLLGPSAVTDALRDSYSPGESPGSAFGKLFARLFADFGLVLLDPSDPELHRIAGPVYEKALRQAEELARALMERGRQLEAGAYHEQVRVTGNSVLLFDNSTGQRLPIHLSNGQFAVADRKLSRDEMLARCRAHPEHFSANVLLRPVVQDFLLPTLAYLGGPAEIAYFAQVGVVQERILGRTTPVLPRFSATLVEPRLRKLLDKYKISVTDVFEAPERLRELMASRSMPSELQAKFDEAERAVEKAVAQIIDGLATLDPTLVEAASNAQSKMQHQVESLRGRAARAALRRSEELNRHAEILSAALYPNKTLQERVIAGMYFVAHYGPQLLHQLHEAAHADCAEHQLLYL